MEILDCLGKPCPIPVIEAKKSLAKQDTAEVLIRVDNIIAVQNLEKMAKGYGYGFSYNKKSNDLYEAVISRDGKSAPTVNDAKPEQKIKGYAAASGGLVVVIGSNAMGKGDEELGKILIKGFIYSLTELSVPPEYVIFLNSGAYLTSQGANTIDDLKKLAEKQTEIFTCGTCINYYGLQGKLAIGEITDMYGITEKMSEASTLINI